MRSLQWPARIVALAAVVLSVACNDDAPTVAPDPTPVLTTVQVALVATVLEVGQASAVTATPLDQNDSLITAGAATFASSAPEVAGVNPATGAIFAIAPGTTQITATIGGKTGTRALTVFKSAIRLNEVKPNGDAPTGWIELVNPSVAPVDLAGWTISAGNVFQSFTLPAGTAIAPGGFLVIDETAFPAGLKSADAVHVFSKFGVQVDSFEWVADPVRTFGRCPDATGAFAPTTATTRNTANICG
jgi:hypothetical protein